jgi:hypothetical protein
MARMRPSDHEKKATINIPAVKIGFGSLLTIVFIVLKLCGVIAWSWWWVISPFLISWAIIILLFACAGWLAYKVGFAD